MVHRLLVAVELFLVSSFFLCVFQIKVYFSDEQFNLCYLIINS